MFCTNCGNEIKPGQLYCTGCGTKIVAPVQNNQSYQNNVQFQNNQSYQTYQDGQNYQSYRSNQPYQNYQPYVNNKKKKKPLLALAIVLAVVFFVGVMGLSAKVALDFYHNLNETVIADNSGNDSSVNDISGGPENTPDDVNTSDDTGSIQADPDNLFADYQSLQYKNYSFANVAYGEKALYVVPSGLVNDNTVLRNGKTAGEFADFVDKDVLEEGRTINRKLLYDLISVYLVDPSLSEDDGTFEKAMIYLTTFANQFNNMDVNVEAMSVPFTEQNRYRFKIKTYGNDDIWIADPTNNLFYFNNGNTEYHSSMYDETTLALWLTAVDVFFGID